MTSKKIKDIIQEYLVDDFGFTTTDTEQKEEEIKTKDLTISQYQAKLKKIEELIMPLLANLHSTADKANIYWPNRKDQLDKVIREFLALTRE